MFFLNLGWHDTSFDDSWGMWEQDSTDDFDWTRKKGINSQITGPTEDHTLGKGRHFYLSIARKGQINPFFSHILPTKSCRHMLNLR